MIAGDADGFQEIYLNGDTAGNFEVSSRLEWVESNGIGGYASSTVSGANTRRYHGLLVASLRPPLDRRVLLSKLEEKVITGSETYELGCNQYPGVVYPTGHLHIDQFQLDPFPTYRYLVGGATIEKEIFCVHGRNATVVTYRVRSANSPVTLEIRPMILSRDFHSLHRENLNFNAYVEQASNYIMMKPYDEKSRLFLAHTGGWFRRSGYWYRNFEYPMEMIRGLDFKEDLFSPGYFMITLNRGESFSIIASTDPPDGIDVDAMRQREITRRRAIVNSSAVQSWMAKVEGLLPKSFVRSLLLAADSFVVENGNGRKAILAGYHWFSEWGRDTFIALPGILLATGRHEDAASIIAEYVRLMRGGLVPNTLSEVDGVPAYNTADGTLWLFNAVHSYYSQTGDSRLIESVYPRLAEAIEHHIAGTEFGIRVDPDDSLLIQGDPTTQLTWMDAKVGDWVVTPRHGKAVEINGLWHNALLIMAEFASHLGKKESASRYRAIADHVRESFMGQFWDRDRGYFADCINESGVDFSFRPNQVIAIGLPFSPVPVEVASIALKNIERELLTPYGLRTLSRGDPKYIGRYQGDPLARDRAYHQGTVWPWLMGPFLSASIRCHRDAPDIRKKIVSYLSGFVAHLRRAGLGTISEIFDGNPPHHPRGCISQAWSISEVLRILSMEMP